MKAGALVVQVGHQRECERVAVGEVEHRLQVAVGHAALRQIGVAFLRREVAQGQRIQERLPARVGAPGGRRGVAAGQHGEDLDRQLGQKHIAQPVVQRRQQLVGVDEQHGATAALGQRLSRRLGGTETQRQAETAQERGGGRLHVAGVQRNGSHARLLRQPGKALQEAGLAHAARSMHEEHKERGIRGSQRACKKTQFRISPDETLPPGAVQAIDQP